MSTWPIAWAGRSPTSTTQSIDVRATIYDLQPPREGSLVSEVQTLVAEAGEVLGFMPQVAFHGRVDSSAPPALTQQLLTVLKEALSNVIRHAKPTVVEVLVEVGDQVALTVSDNGAGLADRSSIGNGMRNMSLRARALGGDLSVTAATPKGTRLQWRVPVPGTEEAVPPAGRPAEAPADQPAIR
jgi:signal transduction histidine kinase